MPRGHSINASLKAKAAVEALRGEKTINEIAARHGVHPNQISQWKKQLLDAAETVFDDKRVGRSQQDEARKESELYEQIGRLKMEFELLKKKCNSTDQHSPCSR